MQTMMTRSRRFALGTLLALSLGTAAVAQAPAPAPLPVAAPIATVMGRDGVTISGVVTGIFGNKIAIQDASGQALVELGPPHATPEVKMGESLTLQGRPMMNEFHANLLVRADGSRVEIKRPMPMRGPMMGRPGEMRGPGRPGEEGERHGRGPGRPGGEREHAEMRPAAAEDMLKLQPVLTKAGYATPSSVSVHPRHFEVRTTNKEGQPVELHLDRDDLEIRRVKKL